MDEKGERLDYQLDLVNYVSYEDYAVKYQLHIRKEDGKYKVVSKKTVYRQNERVIDEMLLPAEVEQETKEFNSLEDALEFGAEKAKCLV